jgi:glycerophosphoryl diester phosphodiesterase
MRLSPFGWIDAALAPAPDPARVAWLARSTYAHRGVHDEQVPENSPGAFAEAIRRGLGIECDVQKSRDGRAMVFHDWTLDRLTAVSGPVARRDSVELEQLALRGGGPIPTLDRLLAQIDGQVPLLIEIKSKSDRGPVPLCLAVRRALEGYAGPCAVMSFDARVSRWFRTHAPGVVRGLVVTEDGARGPSGRLKRHFSLWAGKPDFLAYDVRDLPSPFAAAQRARGLPVLTWTVRSPDQWARVKGHCDNLMFEGFRA